MSAYQLLSFSRTRHAIRGIGPLMFASQGQRGKQRKFHGTPNRDLNDAENEERNLAFDNRQTHSGTLTAARSLTASYLKMIVYGHVDEGTWGIEVNITINARYNKDYRTS